MFSKHKYVLFSLLVSSGWLHGSAQEVYRINRSDVQAAQVQLQSEARQARLNRHVLATAVFGIAALMIFKVLPTWSDLKDYQADRQALQTLPYLTAGEIAQGVQAAGLSELQVRQLMVHATAVLRQSIVKEVTKAPSWGTKLKGYCKATGGLITSVFAPKLLVEPVLNKCNQWFGSQDFAWVMTKRLAIFEQIAILKQAQVIWDPAQFIAKSANVEDRKFREMAQQYQDNYAKMLLLDSQKMQQSGRDSFVLEANRLMQKMGYVVGDIQLRAQGSDQQAMLNQLAEQLYQSTYELAFTIDQYLPTSQTAEIFQAVSRMQATYSMTVNSVAMLLNQK
jgi:hypothetical protein